ncbi:alpha/beta-hydrolase [Backusella circina FSU 941]|nr:alpha/beta-hydrolase [Backusella circina FSU 941]
MSDLPLHHAFLQLLGAYGTLLCGGLEYQWMKWAFVLIQLPTILFECILYFKNMREKKQVEQSLDLIAPQFVLPKLTSFHWLRCIIMPMWKPKQIKMHKNISYATEREMQEVYEQGGDKELKRMLLDVIVSNVASGGLRPVLVHLPGGSWTTGTKDMFYPYQKVLIEEENWVIVNANYRLAPANVYPTHLLDCKRALRWVKQNIERYGGDPQRIVIAGDSAGGHLAGMIAFTPNQPEYQPGFEDVDTSVQGFISFNGALDIELDPFRCQFFSSQISQQPIIDYDFIRKHSPVNLINNDIPSLVFAGLKDGIVDCSIGKYFKEEFDKKGDNCQLVLLPYANHCFYYFWSPRSIYTAKLIQAWCRKLV